MSWLSRYIGRQPNGPLRLREYGSAPLPQRPNVTETREYFQPAEVEANYQTFWQGNQLTNTHWLMPVRADYVIPVEMEYSNPQRRGGGQSRSLGAVAQRRLLDVFNAAWNSAGGNTWQ